MLLREVLLLSGERTGVRRGRDHGGLFDPVAAGRLAAAEAPTPLGTHLQGGETGQVSPRRVFATSSPHSPTAAHAGWTKGNVTMSSTTVFSLLNCLPTPSF